jgi:transposase-like protein
MGGEVEVDETYIGGKARYMHAGKRAEKIKGTGGMGKVAVMGLLERHGNGKDHSTVRTAVVENVKRPTLHERITENIEPGSEIMTDALKSYEQLPPEYVHNVIDHAECYVKGNVHTNGLENFWSLLKRAIKGTYVSVEPFHLFRYLDEEAFRFNERGLTDAERFAETLASVAGKRLTYKELIGEGDCAPAAVTA